MARPAAPIPGFYVAHTPLYDAKYGGDALYKVGFTGNLARRLLDGCYTTAWPDAFAYKFVIETETEEGARTIEQAVLHWARGRREGGNKEVVRMPLAEIAHVATEFARRTERLAGRHRVVAGGGRYERPAREEKAGGPRGAETLGPADRAVLAAIAPPAADPAAEPAADPAAEPAAEPAADPAAEPAELDPALILERIAGGGAPARHPPLEDRPYQTEAIEKCVEELEGAGRAILQMACRCGKTRVAYGVIKRLAGARTLYLVPGLALLRQTARKLASYGLEGGVLLVGSDRRPLPDLAPLRPLAPQTTDPALIRAAISGGGPAPLLVLATYQSSRLVPDEFDLTVFDECHRVCGGRKPRPFTDVLLGHGRGRRLFMTATPRYDTPLSMKDRAVFGGKAYVYPLRRGIDAGHVNPFELRLVSGPTMAARVAGAMGAVDKLLVFCRSIREARELMEATAAEAARGAEAAGGAEPGPGPAAEPGPGPAAPPFECLLAHSRMPARAVEGALARFCVPGRRAALFNCRLFQEGVEIPALNGVFFAAPRHSPRDIIQTLCRPLNRAPGKPPSAVFLPVEYDPAVPPEDPANVGRFATIIPFFDALIDEDPLLYEHLLDPGATPYPLRWIESAVRPDGGAPPLRYRPERLLAAARRAVRHGKSGKTAYERLLRTARIPWAIGFAEMDRIVRECGRYPKTTDCYCYGTAKVNFHRFYKHARDCYAKWRRGEAQPLEPYQLRALEGLPGWEPYGVEGPYVWGDALAFLRRWLAEHGGVPPMVEINKGGYVGLDATPMERLSGVLTVVNQSDGRDRRGKPGSGFTLAPDKQAELDALCAEWGLVWRKSREAPPPGAPPGAVGSLVQDAKGRYAGRRTFIQESFARFKAEWRRVKARRAAGGGEDDYVARWYPDYPRKHQHQERLDVWARRGEVVPPRWRQRGR